MKDYYSILGIPPDSSEEDIKKKFRELAKKYHPDRGGDPEKFKEIMEAYSILSDKEKRKKYDYEFFYNKESIENTNEYKMDISLEKSDTVDLNFTPLFSGLFYIIFWIAIFIYILIPLNYGEKYKEIFKQDNFFLNFMFFLIFVIYSILFFSIGFLIISLIYDRLLVKKGIIIRINKNNPFYQVAFILDRWLQAFYANFLKIFIIGFLIFMIYISIKAYLSSYIDYEEAIAEYWDEIYPYLDNLNNPVLIKMCNDSHKCADVEAEISVGYIKKIHFGNGRYLNLSIPILNDLTAEYYDLDGNFVKFRIPEDSSIILEGVFCWAENYGYRIKSFPDIGIKLDRLKCIEKEKEKSEARALFIYSQNREIPKEERIRVIEEKLKERPEIEEEFLNLLEEERLRKILPPTIPPEVKRLSNEERAYFIIGWIKKQREAGVSKEEIENVLYLLDEEGFINDEVYEKMLEIKEGALLKQ